MAVLFYDSLHAAMITVIQFDFASRSDSEIEPDAMPSAPAENHYFWIDADEFDREQADRMLDRLGMPEYVREQVFGAFVDGRYDVHDMCLHVAVTESRFESGRIEAGRADVLVAERFIFTRRRGETVFLREMRRTCRSDFARFSKSPGFLVYEIGDHLLSVYRRTLHLAADAVEQVQLNLFKNADDRIFKRVADLTSDILVFRKNIHAARDVFHALALRRSAFVSETTQPFLEHTAHAMERLGGDLADEREVLNETLNLYMGMVSHRTNRIVNRLTVISMIFLPLSFLCGVYGMNFEQMPELVWKYGYLYFWGVALAIFTGLVVLVRRQRWF